MVGIVANTPEIDMLDVWVTHDDDATCVNMYTHSTKEAHEVARLFGFELWSEPMPLRSGEERAKGLAADPTNPVAYFSWHNSLFTIYIKNSPAEGAVVTAPK